MTHDVTPDHNPGSVYPDWMSALEKKYNILDVFILHRYDYRIEQLHQRLQAIKKTQFDQQDRIVVVHFDTDYYIHNTFGINLTNLFTAWQSADIPLHNMLIYTNHTGLRQEIDTLCRDRHAEDRPTIVETFINQLSYLSDTYCTEPDLCVDQIEWHGLALMGAPRSHRYALYNHIQHLAKQLVMVIKAPA